MNKVVYIFLFDGFSDWEIAFLTPEIQKSSHFVLKTFSLSGDEISSMGGLKIKPDSSLNELDVDRMAALILPGGDAWEANQITGLAPLIKRLIESNKTVAAICAATTYLGNLGLLDKISHTSNDLNYLKKIAPEYKGEFNYKFEPAVSDRKVITASGIAPIEFARELFKDLALFSEPDIERWFQLFKNGIWTG